MSGPSHEAIDNYMYTCANVSHQMCYGVIFYLLCDVDDGGLSASGRTLQDSIDNAISEDIVVQLLTAALVRSHATTAQTS